MQDIEDGICSHKVETVENSDNIEWIEDHEQFILIHYLLRIAGVFL